MKTQFKINPQKQTQKIVQFIKKTLKKQGFKKVIIACSGGIDSTTCLFLLSKALNPENILAVKLPYFRQKMVDADKAIKLAKIPQKNIFEVDISPATEKIISTINHHSPIRRFRNIPPYDGIKKFGMTKNHQSLIISHQPSVISRIRRGNIMARARMIFLYDLAKTNKAIVCGAENKSEYLLGYFTLYGDQASDIELIRHLYKNQVIQLAKYLRVPKRIIEKPPSAGLWKKQTDEKELGFSYKEADRILYLSNDKKFTTNQIINQGFKKKLVLKILNQVKKTLLNASFLTNLSFF